MRGFLIWEEVRSHQEGALLEVETREGASLKEGETGRAYEMAKDGACWKDEK